jgi:hypothetical protein
LDYAGNPAGVARIKKPASVAGFFMRPLSVAGRAEGDTLLARPTVIMDEAVVMVVMMSGPHGLV